MRRYLATTALIALFAAPGALLAQDFSVSAGATLTSRYMSSGIEQTNGFAIQPWIEVEANGFYAGVWASNVSKSLLGSSAEVDLYLGYRNEIGAFSYDIGYARYYYRSPNVDCCGEFILDMGYAVTDEFSIGGRVAYDPKAEVTNTRLSAAYAFTDQISADITYGKINKGGHRYWQVGGSYAVNDTLSLGLAWHDTNITKGRLVASMDISFSLR
ncbi:TorF family putative porin [Szabonella alba]|nr:TorF family putative porin [Szabonella alba]